MIGPKGERRTSPAMPYQRKLELLYARRSAIEQLIQSLQDYDRLRAKCVGLSKRRTA